VQPYDSTQAMDREDILNVGGFSDQVFDVISAFVSGQLDPEHWIGRIEAMAV
jgi:60 kDa SS-A/Ro ribonucleoprotein